VSNHTYTCYFPGQELVIRLVANGWLHKGVIVCPACEELCGGDGTDEKCKPPSEVPLTVPYHREQLACGGTSTIIGSTATAVITVTVVALLLLIST
jgi:leishmanolysin-like peptidase